MPMLGRRSKPTYADWSRIKHPDLKGAAGIYDYAKTEEERGDPEFLADAEKVKIEINPSTGEDVERTVKRFFPTRRRWLPGLFLQWSAME